MEMHLKMSPAKWHLLCLGLNVLSRVVVCLNLQLASSTRSLSRVVCPCGHIESVVIRGPVSTHVARTGAKEIIRAWCCRPPSPILAARPCATDCIDGPGLNTLRQRQNGRHFADDIFKCICLIEHVRIPIKILLNFVSMGLINNIPTLVQIMAWRRPGDEPLSEPMMVSLPTHLCITRPWWADTAFH